jgi:hypothetical protein
MRSVPPLPARAPTIAILGGGTAGWMAACLMKQAWPDAAITVVEAPEIGIVGVGEGSTPQFAHFMGQLGLAEADWMPAAHATYKTGIEFVGWSADAGFDRYFHPFASAVDLHTEPAFHAAALARRRGLDVPAHPDAFFLNSRLAAARRQPLAGPGFPLRVDYGFHFDAHLIGGVLRDHAVADGVRHLAARVEAAIVDPQGQVSHLALADGGRVAADLFVDASGFRSVIAGEALRVPYRSFAGNLFVDRAVVLPTPSAATGPRPSTRATALSAGWAWDIPLTSRTGNGYVYSSAHLSADAAEMELRAHVRVDEAVAARHLTMQIGRLETSWTANCLAIGLAQGFLEPLEATALHLVIATVEGFIDAFAQGGFAPVHRDAFNASIARRYDGIRDYLVAHYRFNRRTDTDFWRDNAGHDRLSDSLKSISTTWFTGRDLPEEIARQDIARYYAPLSWGCLFAGYGTFPDAAKLAAVPPRPEWTVPPDFLDRCALNFAPVGGGGSLGGAAAML